LIRNIVFGGCSLTWGQSLHYYGYFKDALPNKDGSFDFNKLKINHYQYIVDNRFATKVADYFGKKPIVRAMNGGNNCIISDLVKEKVNKFTDAIIIQTTAFTRCKKKTIEEQMQMYLDIIEKYKNTDIVIKFFHWDIPIEFIPKQILEKTIFFNGDHSFYNLLMGPESIYTIEKTFGIPDFHFNQRGHDLIANILIKELEPIIKKPIYE
jgi:hypothetical protein